MPISPRLASAMRRIHIEWGRRIRQPGKPPTDRLWSGRGEIPNRFAQLTTSLVTWNSTLVTNSGMANGSAGASAVVFSSDSGWGTDPSTDALTVYAPPMMGPNDFLPTGSWVMIQWFADPVQPGWYVVAANCYSNS